MVLVTFDPELVLEEARVDDRREECYGRGGEVDAVRDRERKDLCEVPRVWGVGRQDSVDGEGHDGAVVEDGDDQDHERRAVGGRRGGGRGRDSWPQRRCLGQSTARMHMPALHHTHKSNLNAKAMTAKPTTIRMVTAQA